MQAILAGPIWATLVQTSQAAEQIGFATPSCTHIAPFSILSDSETTINMARLPEHKQVHPNKVYAGVRKTVLSDAHHASYHTAQQVKAHKSKAAKEALSQQDLAKTHANEAADKAAKARAQDSLPNNELLQQESREQQRARIIIRTIAAVLKVFPKDGRYARPHENEEEKILRIKKTLLAKAELRLAREVARRTHA